MTETNLNDITIAKAVDHYRQGNLEEAQKLFLNVLNNDAGNPDGLYFMALIDHQSGRSEVAEHRARELLRIKPGDGKARNLLGTILMGQRKLEEANEQFEKGLKQEKKDPVMYVNAGICQIGLGNPDKSIELCKHALKISPDYVNAWNILGNACLGKSDYAAAADAFRKALELQPGFLEARFNLGRALLEAGNADEALANFETVLEQSPDNVHALTCKADVLAARKALAEAVGLYRQALEKNPGFAPAHTGLGKLMHQLGRPNEALASLKQAIELNPNNIEALVFAGDSFRKLGNLEAAAAAYRDVLAIDPQNAQARFQLAAVEGKDTPAKADPDYVRKLFDEFSGTFDESLQQVAYNGPEQLLALAEQHVPEEVVGELDVLDLGCGTGLSGLQFSRLSRHLKGIDISPQMVEEARKRGVYDEIVVSELLDALVKHQGDTDVAVAADTFPYLGDLESVFLSVSSALRSGGLFLFCVETHDDDSDYRLSSTARYSHSGSYIRELAKRRNLDVLSCELSSYRMESGEPVKGLMVALRKPAA